MLSDSRGETAFNKNDFLKSHAFDTRARHTLNFCLSPFNFVFCPLSFIPPSPAATGFGGQAFILDSRLYFFFLRSSFFFRRFSFRLSLPSSPLSLLNIFFLIPLRLALVGSFPGRFFFHKFYLLVKWYLQSPIAKFST